jgi:hypothetical protein
LRLVVLEALLGVWCLGSFFFRGLEPWSASSCVVFLYWRVRHRQQDAPGYKPGLWACMTGSLIIILIVAVTDVHFYFANKKQAQGLKIIEPVDGVDSSVSFLLLAV